MTETQFDHYYQMFFYKKSFLCGVFVQWICCFNYFWRTVPTQMLISFLIICCSQPLSSSCTMIVTRYCVTLQCYASTEMQSGLSYIVYRNFTEMIFHDAATIISQLLFMKDAKTHCQSRWSRHFSRYLTAWAHDLVYECALMDDCLIIVFPT